MPGLPAVTRRLHGAPVIGSQPSIGKAGGTAYDECREEMELHLGGGLELGSSLLF